MVNPWSNQEQYSITKNTKSGGCHIMVIPRPIQQQCSTAKNSDESGDYHIMVNPIPV